MQVSKNAVVSLDVELSDIWGTLIQRSEAPVQYRHGAQVMVQGDRRASRHRGRDREPRRRRSGVGDPEDSSLALRCYHPSHIPGRDSMSGMLSVVSYGLGTIVGFALVGILVFWFI